MEGYGLHYELPFKDVDENQWRVRIYERDYVGAAVERLKGTGNPISFYYEGDEEFKKGLIGSSVTLRLYATPSFDSTSTLRQFITDDEELFLIEVDWFSKTGWKLYWRGFLHQDEYIEDITTDPYNVELKGLDRIGTLSESLSSIENPNTSINYKTDDTVTLLQIYEEFTRQQGLDLTVVDKTGLKTENGYVNSFLNEQTVPLETFIDGDKDKEFALLQPIADIVDEITRSLNSVCYQAGGELIIEGLERPLVLPSFALGGGATGSAVEADVINNDMSIRNRPSKRRVNVSYAIKPKNIIANPSFERDVLGATSAIGYTTGTINPVEISNEAVAEGSTQSLLVVAERISDSTFDAATLASKLGQYQVLKTVTEPIRVEHQKALIADFSMDTFIDNTIQGTYEYRFSLEMVYDGTTYFYDFAAGNWGTGFQHTFFDLESTGKWERINFSASILGDYFGLTLFENFTAPITIRIHTHNYEEELSDVRIFYDNLSMRVYNSSGNVYTSITPDTKFLNLSSDENTTQKSGEVGFELETGLTTVQNKLQSFLQDNHFGMLSGRMLGQYINVSTSEAEAVSTDLALPVYLPMPSWFVDKKVSLEARTKRITSSSVKTRRIELDNVFESLPNAGITRTNNTVGGFLFNDAALKYTVGSTFTDTANNDCVYEFPTPTTPTYPLLTKFAIQVRVGAMGSNITNKIVIQVTNRSDGTILVEKEFNKEHEGTIVWMPTPIEIGISNYNVVIRGDTDGSVEESFGLDFLRVVSIKQSDMWKPIYFSDRIANNFDVGEESNLVPKFTRFSFDARSGIYNLEGI